MAASDWVEIYRGYTTAELIALRDKLKPEAEFSFSAQGVGSKNHQKDLKEVRDKLQAVMRVLASRDQPADASTGFADFSGAGGAA